MDGRTMEKQGVTVGVSYLFAFFQISVKKVTETNNVYADVNECLKNNGECHREQKCTNTPGGRTCGDCPSGWTDDDATGCKGLCYL